MGASGTTSRQRRRGKAVHVRLLERAHHCHLPWRSEAIGVLRSCTVGVGVGVDGHEERAEREDEVDRR